MELDQCLGLYARLQLELTAATSQRPINTRKIERLRDDLVQTARILADLQPLDEQCGESWPT